MNQAAILNMQVESGSVMTQITPPERTTEEHLVNTLRVSMLGGFHVSFNECEIPETAWRLGKAKSMIKILALAPEHSMHREQIIDLLWRDLGPEAGTNNFHQALHVARRTLASILPAIPPTSVLRLRHQVLSLAPPVDIWIDVEAFEQAIISLQRSSSSEEIYQAIEIYGGELLPEDRYEEWTQERREYLRQQYLSLLIRLARIHEARQEANLAIDALRRVVAIDPLREEAHASLMRVYALSDRRQQALRQYERLCDTLERELGVPPDPVVTELHAAIVAGIYPVETWESDRVAATRDETTFALTESIQAFLQRKTDFVDRDTELRVLESALQSAISSEGKIVLLAGEPGIGKTRLIEEFSQYAQAHHIPVYWGHGYEGNGAPPYWSWMQIVRKYLANHRPEVVKKDMGSGVADIARIIPDVRAVVPDVELPPALDSEQERFRLFDSMVLFLKSVSERSPIVLVLDDLHWFNRSSLLMLEFLANEIHQSRILVVGSYRPVEVDRGHPLVHALANLARSDLIERINLLGLSPENVARYSEITIGEPPPAGLPEAIHFQTSGNPFFMREIVQLLIDEERIDNPEEVRSWKLIIPHGIRETVHLRADRLSQPAYQVLTAAAVAGHECDLDVLASVTDQSTDGVLDALDESLSLGLLIEVPGLAGRYRFSHAITRLTLYDDLSQARCLRMHLRTGEAIEHIYAATIDEHLSELAHHYYVAAPLGSVQKAIDFLQRAGKQALARVSYSEAARYFEQALEVLKQHKSDDVITHCRVLLDFGEALMRAGNSRDAVATYERAMSLAERTDEPELFAEAAVGLSDAAFHLGETEGRYVTALDRAAEALADIRNLLKVRVLGVMSRDLSRAFASIPDAAHRSRQLADEALSIATEIDQPEALIIAREARQWSYSTIDDFNDRISNTDDILRLADELGDRQRRLLGHTWRIFDYIAVGEMQGAEYENNAYHVIATELRQPNSLWASTFRQAMFALFRGDFSEAEVSAARALQLGERCAPEQALEIYFLQISALRREQGRESEVLELAREVAGRHPVPSNYSILLQILLSEMDVLDQPSAELARLAGKDFEEIPFNLMRLPNLAMLAVLVSNLRARQIAPQLYELLLPYAKWNVSMGGNITACGSAEYYLGLLSSVMGDWPRAEQHLLAGIEANTRMGSPPFVAHGKAALGRLMLNRDQSDDRIRGLKLIDEAAAIAGELGMYRLLQQLKAYPTTSDKPVPKPPSARRG
jgi:DNA-binding SARP family transcriptional activator